MSATISGLNGTYFPGLFDQEISLSLTWTPISISDLEFGLSFAAIQYLLFKINISHSKTKPNNTERFLAVTFLWIIHHIIHLLLSKSMDTLSRTVLRRKFVLQTCNLSCGSLQNHLVHVCWKIVMTWLASTSIYLIFILVKQINAARLSPMKAFARFKQRLIKLGEFARRLFHGSESTNDQVESNNLTRKKSKRYGQSIELRRHRDENADNSQRILNWDLKIDREAMREMMETLGPPGGFGELGFHVSKDQVCFGAMGVGTRLNLTLVLEAERNTD